MPSLLPKYFLKRKAPIVAKEILGCTLVRDDGKEIRRFIIRETEAYDGLKDKASHASGGKTKRNEIMFREAGHIYIYFVYGMHYMLNIITGEKDYPSAILIRGLEGINGPARITKRLGIDKKLNGKILGKGSGLWIEKIEKKIKDKDIKQAPRIGVHYAGPIWSKKKWRFFLK